MEAETHEEKPGIPPLQRPEADFGIHDVSGDRSAYVLASIASLCAKICQTGIEMHDSLGEAGIRRDS